MPEYPTHIEAAANDAGHLFNATVEQLRYLLGHGDGVEGALPAMTPAEALSLVNIHSTLFYALLQSMTISAAANDVTLQLDTLRDHLRLEVRELTNAVDDVARAL